LLTDKTKSSFRDLFRFILEQILKEDSDQNSWVMDSVDIKKVNSEDIVLISYCTYNSRIFTSIHLDFDEVSKLYVKNSVKTNDDLIDREIFYDFFGEQCNRLSGFLKRELFSVCSHSGISTPDTLTGDVIGFFDWLSPDLSDFISVKIKNGPEIFYGFNVCSSMDLDFDFKSISKVTSGEIDFF